VQADRGERTLQERKQNHPGGEWSSYAYRVTGELAAGSWSDGPCGGAFNRREYAAILAPMQSLLKDRGPLASDRQHLRADSDAQCLPCPSSCHWRLNDEPLLERLFLYVDREVSYDSFLCHGGRIDVRGVGAVHVSGLGVESGPSLTAVNIGARRLITTVCDVILQHANIATAPQAESDARYVPWLELLSGIHGTALASV
jgi:hypothetical protein